MFEKIKRLKEAATKLYPYFAPSYDNCLRTIGGVTAVIIIPLANFVIPSLFFSKGSDSKDKSDNNDIISAGVGLAAVTVVYAVQSGLSIALAKSTMQAMRKNHVKILMEDSKFLINGDMKEITSLQHVTVGVGVRDFATTAVSLVVGLPMFMLSSISALMHIGIKTESWAATGIVSGFSFTTAGLFYLANKGYAKFEASNQRIENKLVSKVSFIEANRNSILLMGVTNKEYQSLIQEIKEIDPNIPKIGISYALFFGLTVLIPSVANKFFGTYYPGKNFSSADTNFLNLMIVSLTSNLRSITWILTTDYGMMELNLEQMQAFDKAYQDCLLTYKANNKMIQKFSGEGLSLVEFSVYKPNVENAQNHELITILNKVTLELPSNKVYKLLAESGGGKTTFLKALTNNWQYTDGTVSLPASAEGNTCFIPQHLFLPEGTLLEIISYLSNSQLEKNPLLSPKSNKVESKEEIIEIELPLFSKDLELRSEDNKLNLIYKAKALLEEIGLLPTSIKEHELESSDINWNQRLSGGEKQKIGVIQAILAKPKFIIMDESTSALDLNNRHIVYNMIKKYLTTLENYTVIYTEHSDTPGFADAILTLGGQNLECYEL